MIRIRIFLLSAALGVASALPVAHAAALTNNEASSGLKAAIVRSSDLAVTQLSANGGFLKNDKLRIELPESLRKAENLARKLGYSRQADELVDAMNHAAEMAVVEAKPLLIQAVKKMTFKDAKDILFGPPDAATQYFQRSSSDAISAKFLPIVKKATQKVELAQKYNEFAGQAAKLGLIGEQESNLDNYVTRKAMEGLFLTIAEQEKQIRDDPVATGSALLKKVFSP
jgi:hypothetical protein